MLSLQHLDINEDLKQDTTFQVFLLLESSVGVTKCYHMFFLCGVWTIIIRYVYKYAYTCCSKSLVLLSNICLRFLWTWNKYPLIACLMRQEIFLVLNLVCIHCSLKCKVFSPKYCKRVVLGWSYTYILSLLLEKGKNGLSSSLICIIVLVSSVVGCWEERDELVYNPSSVSAFQLGKHGLELVRSMWKKGLLLLLTKRFAYLSFQTTVRFLKSEMH